MLKKWLIDGYNSDGYNSESCANSCIKFDFIITSLNPSQADNNIKSQQLTSSRLSEHDDVMCREGGNI